MNSSPSDSLPCSPPFILITCHSLPLPPKTTNTPLKDTPEKENQTEREGYDRVSSTHCLSSHPIPSLPIPSLPFSFPFPTPSHTIPSHPIDPLTEHETMPPAD